MTKNYKKTFAQNEDSDQPEQLRGRISFDYRCEEVLGPWHLAKTDQTAQMICNQPKLYSKCFHLGR